MKSYNIAFYIHHHGSGHFMRSLSIAKAMNDVNIIFIGSDLKRFSHIIPATIQVLELPLDIPTNDDPHYKEGNKVDCFHYVPLHVKGVTDRAAILSAFFQQNTPLLLIVDVSVEVALLARLCGIPTIIMRQHGKRTDVPHRLAYQSAELLIAPFGKELETSTDAAVIGKTFYSGGFSRTIYQAANLVVYDDQVCILIGTGGSSLDVNAILLIANQCTSYYFHILGEIIEPINNSVTNITFHGQVDNVEDILVRCKVVIGNLGHNTVMEIATLNKPFIGIPESRPFDEQIDKANALKNTEGFEAILPEDIASTDWKILIDRMSHRNSRLKEIIHPNALENTANRIHQLATDLFR
jgi:hypothetical protein